MERSEECHSSKPIEMPPDLDDAVRAAAFAFLADQRRLRGEDWPPVLPRSVLSEGFTFADRRVPLLGPQGIFKPSILPSMPISIATAPPDPRKDAPYEDDFGYGRLIYRYRGTDPNHHENVGLRLAMAQQKPLIYFHGIVPGRYLAIWPAFVTGDDRGDLSFQVAFEPGDTMGLPDLAFEEDAQRSYAFHVVRQRLHQAGFRERVLAAYRRTCSLCRLRHEELLDAAHIIADGKPRGEPVIPNGIALCKLHHAAFDSNIIGIRPDLIVEIRRDVRREVDGPMLLHGLQGLHGSMITVPHEARLRPARDRLEERFMEFQRAS
jgi:putative restriction endonuclease